MRCTGLRLLVELSCKPDYQTKDNTNILSHVENAVSWLTGITQVNHFDVKRVTHVRFAFIRAFSSKPATNGL